VEQAVAAHPIDEDEVVPAVPAQAAARGEKLQRNFLGDVQEPGLGLF
jgi:hypothetical protein